ncbi:MAG TPA: proprotein convertase P-domain-containing protein [Pirellulales bacterium]|jgi:subtilase family serine protease|nr:proprotein convertase P-domain-containing protein [Pirellulales bacterium]
MNAEHWGTPLRPRRKRAGTSRRRPTGTHRLLRLEPLEPRRLLTAVKFAPTAIHPDYLLPAAQHGLKPLGSPGPVGFTPAQIDQAYGINLPNLSVVKDGQLQSLPADGSGQTIAIIDAYDDPTIQADLNAFDAQFGLPNTTIIKVNQSGGSSLPGTDPAGKDNDDWEIETSLDVEWAHAMAPGATILLVEANNAGNSLYTAIDWAVTQPRVVAVSMSWGGGEFSGENSFDSNFTTPSGHQGITFVASTGDDGEPGDYPAYSPNVLAVGGTTLSLNANSSYSSESGWNDGGGGISTHEAQPSYQTAVVDQNSNLGNPTTRSIPDIAFDANPNTGVAIYDSYDFGASTGWIAVGGTSVGAPVWAGFVALIDQGRSEVHENSLTSQALLTTLYQLPSTDFHDVTTGNNSPNGSNPLYNAAPGYDLVTGRGTPLINLLVPAMEGNATISGTVFSDVNSNGTQDNGEAGLAGWTVYDDLNNNGVLDPAVQTTFNSSNVPTTIHANATSTSTLAISGFAGNIGGLEVTLNITDLKDYHLTITLISPSGTQVTLTNKDGNFDGSGSNIANYTNTVFDDYAATSIFTTSSSMAPFTGSYVPIGFLSTLDGTNPNGTWKLQVVDNNFRDSNGSITGWSLQITNQPDYVTTTDASGNYQFNYVAPGNHFIREVPQANYTETAPASGVYNVVAVALGNSNGLNFGNHYTPSVMTPLLGDFNRDGVVDAADINPAELALTNLNEYLTTYSVTPAQLATYDDVNQDGKFTNTDLQALLDLLLSGGGSSSPAAAQSNSNSTSTVTSSTGTSSIGNSSATSAGNTSSASTAVASSTTSTSAAPAKTGTTTSPLSSTWQQPAQQSFDRLVEHLHPSRLAAHAAALTALDKLLANWPR